VLHPGPLFIPAALVSKNFETFAKIFATQHKRRIGGIKDTGGHIFSETNRHIDSGDTCTKFVTGVNAGGNLLLIKKDNRNKSPPASLILVVNRDIRDYRNRLPTPSNAQSKIFFIYKCKLHLV
jgi:hypothetical protein